MSFRFVQFWFMSSFLNFRPNGCHYKLGQWVFHLTFGNSPNSSFVKSGKIGKIHPKRSERTIKSWGSYWNHSTIWVEDRIESISDQIAAILHLFCSTWIHLIWFKSCLVRSLTMIVHLDRPLRSSTLIFNLNRSLGSSTWIVAYDSYGNLTDPAIRAIRVDSFESTRSFGPGLE